MTTPTRDRTQGELRVFWALADAGILPVKVLETLGIERPTGPESFPGTGEWAGRCLMVMTLIANAFAMRKISRSVFTAFAAQSEVEAFGEEGT